MVLSFGGHLWALPIALVGLWASLAPGAEPSRDVSFDGEWSLEFRVNTKPGGESFATRQGLSVSPFHLHFHATKRAFRFDESGSVRVEVREQTPLTISSTTRVGGAVMAWDRQRHRGLVRLEGSGTGERENRQIKLDIRWIYVAGNGFLSDSFGTSSNYFWRASEDAATVTISNEAGTTTLPLEMWKSNWELKPASSEQTEVSPEVMVETTIYRGRRATHLSPLDPGGFSPPLPVVEEIELKQVRQLNLVPRG